MRVGTTGWRSAPLGALCRPRQWPTLAKSALLAEGFPVFGASGVIGYSAAYTHAEETIAITCRGATSGAVHLVPARASITGNAMALDALSTADVTRGYLYYALRRRGLADVVSGSAQPQITRAALASVVVPLPPLDEQRRIAAVLSAADQSAAAARAVIDQLAVVRRTLSLDLMTRGVRRPRGAGAPPGWPLARLGDVARIKGGYAFPSQRFEDRGVAVVRMSNLKRGALDLEGAARVPPPLVEGLDRYALAEGDVLLGLSGSTGETGSLGNFARVSAGDLPLYMNQRVARVAVLDPRRLDAGFLFALVASGDFCVRVQAISVGLGQANVSPRQIEDLAFPLPPLPEQIEIAAALEAVGARIAAEARALAGAQRLHADLMSALFAPADLTPKP